MNPRGQEQVERDEVNVVSLFGNSHQEIIMSDPLTDLIKESEIEDETPLTRVEVKPRHMVNENLFPDQSLYIIEEQLSNLRSKINRMKHYLGELEDIIPR